MRRTRGGFLCSDDYVEPPARYWPGIRLMFVLWCALGLVGWVLVYFLAWVVIPAVAAVMGWV